MQRREGLAKVVDRGRSGNATMQRREVLAKLVDGGRWECDDAEEGGVVEGCRRQ